MQHAAPDAKLEEVARYWDEHPVHSVEFQPGGDLRGYFEKIDALRWSDNERWAQDLYDFGLPPGSRLLDAGCGIGVCSRYYARKGYRVHALDITPRAVEMTRKSFELFGLEGQVERGNVEALPYPDRSFDALVSNGVIHHTPGTEKAVEEFYRVLKPGGAALCCVYYRNILLRPPLWGLTRRLLPRLLKKEQGRQGMLSVRTPEELVRAYDGDGTPIAKLYDMRSGRALFRRFRIRAAVPHYFPSRFLRGFKVGGLAHRLLDRHCGVLIYFLLEKPLESIY